MAATPRAARSERRPAAPRIDYATLADLRYHIRRFLRRREVAARAAGIEPQQYLVLLQLKGLEGRHPPTIGALAERLQIRHHAAVQLVDRLARHAVRELTTEGPALVADLRRLIGGSSRARPR
jgi:hypothetical protein